MTGHLLAKRILKLAEDCGNAKSNHEKCGRASDCPFYPECCPEIEIAVCPKCRSTKFNPMVFTSRVRSLVECLECKHRYHIRKGRDAIEKFIADRGGGGT
jgi:hypothetical protein